MRLADHGTTPEGQNAAYTRILIVRLGAMGDVLHAMPAVAALREALPSATLGWVIEERWEELLCGTGTEISAKSQSGRPLVDTVHRVNTKAWRSALLSDETWREIGAVRESIKQIQYDAAIDFQGAMKSAAIAQWSGAASRFGFANPRESLAGLFYTRRIETGSAHVLRQNFELASAIAGRRLPLCEVDVARDAEAEKWCERELVTRGLKKFVILNPGAGWGAKCWPVESYAAVARELGKFGLRSLVNYGPSEEQLAAHVEKQSAGAAEKILCSISELVALTRRAAVLIGGDTGPLHLAAALKVPVVALFGPTDPARNGPFGTRSMILRNEKSATSYKHHGVADEGLAAITTGEVIAAAKELLEIG